MKPWILAAAAALLLTGPAMANDSASAEKGEAKSSAKEMKADKAHKAEKKETKKEGKEAKKDKDDAKAEKVDGAAALALAQKNACMTCHAVDKKLVGPAFKDVAAKYKGDKTAEAKLVEKVKKGGAGVWGAIPMPPHPQVSDADIKTIVTWVLSL